MPSLPRHPHVGSKNSYIRNHSNTPNEFDPGHEEVVGHLPKLMALHVTKFLKRLTNSGKATVAGKRVLLNRGAESNMA